MIKTLSWDDYVRLSFEEIRKGAVASVQVTRRLRACFEDLLQCAPEERRAPLERQLRLLDAEIESNGSANLDSDVWWQSDPQGIGASRRTLTDLHRAGLAAGLEGRGRTSTEEAAVDRGASALMAVDDPLTPA